MKLIDRAWVSKAPRLRHVAPFDGIRGFGVIGVMAGHALPKGTLSFAAIVDVFFVISGFLITTLLLQEHRSTGKVNVRKFYARRFLRLLPSLYVMLAGTLVIGVIIKATGHLGDHQTLKGLVKECLAAIFYVYNLVFPIHNGPWIDHLWTLSIEEQFYLAIGVVALVLIARGAVRLTAVLLGVLIVIIELSRLFFFAGPLGVAAAAVWTQRPDSLMVGMLAAIASASIADPMSDRAKRALGAAGWVATAVLFFSVWASTGVMAKLGWDHPFVPKNFADLLESGTRPKGIYWMQWGHTAAAWSMAVITLCAFRLSDWWPNKFLSLKPLVWIGGILSYALYLWHVPIQELMHALLGPLPRPVWVVLAVIVPFVAAYPTYVFVEKRALAIKNRFAVEPPSAQTAPGAGVA